MENCIDVISSAMSGLLVFIDHSPHINHKYKAVITLQSVVQHVPPTLNLGLSWLDSVCVNVCLKYIDSALNPQQNGPFAADSVFLAPVLISAQLLTHWIILC